MKNALKFNLFNPQAGKYGQLTYMRIYQGMLKRGSFIVNTRTGRRVKVPRVIQMHADQMQVGSDSRWQIIYL